MHICMYTYIYIYIYIQREREREREIISTAGSARRFGARRGEVRVTLKCPWRSIIYYSYSYSYS